jgi:hypothetical protein
MDTYKIVRHYQFGDSRLIKTGLTLEEAQAHCKDPETSSATCKEERNTRISTVKGPWFDGYEKE